MNCINIRRRLERLITLHKAYQHSSMLDIRIKNRRQIQILYEISDLKNYMKFFHRIKLN